MTSKLICGYGFVGKAVHKMFPDAGVCDKYDLDLLGVPPESQHAGGLSGISHYDVCFVCVPTPMKEDGSCDTAAVFDVVRSVNADLFIIRSTIAIGTTDELNKINPCVFQPEYIGESTAHPLLDERSTPFAIFGGPKELTSKACDIYKDVYNASVRFYQVTGLESELIKYMENVSIATTVTFCNTIYDICQKFGVDYNIVREGYLLDPRMSRYFTFVYPDKRGFDGKCLPKDTNALVAASKEKGYTPQFLEAVLEVNKKWQI